MSDCIDGANPGLYLACYLPYLLNASIWGLLWQGHAAVLQPWRMASTWDSAAWHYPWWSSFQCPHTQNNSNIFRNLSAAKCWEQNIIHTELLPSSGISCQCSHPVLLVNPPLQGCLIPTLKHSQHLSYEFLPYFNPAHTSSTATCNCKHAFICYYILLTILTFPFTKLFFSYSLMTGTHLMHLSNVACMIISYQDSCILNLWCSISIYTSAVIFSSSFVLIVFWSFIT